MGAQVSSDLETVRAQLKAKSSENATDPNVGILQSKLKVARLDLDKTRKELHMASTEIYSSRRKQQSLTEELAKAKKLAVSQDARKALNDAWESLLSLLEQQ